MKFVVGVAALILAIGGRRSKVDAAATSFDFVARHYFPAGYKIGTAEGVPDQ